jgi:HAD superfamily hydrolase (TIGR01509 family)
VFDLVIFDCDGVLVDSEPVVNDTEATYFSRLGWEMTPQEAANRFKGKTVGQVAAQIIERLGAELSFDWQYEWAMLVAHAFVEHLRPVKGIPEIVAGLSAGNRKICVASQSPASRVELCLAICGLEVYFGRNVFTASIVAKPKPAPDLFLHAANAMGVPAVRCAVIEDSPSGVVAGRAAGMVVFGYSGAGNAPELESAGAIVFESMNDLPELLAGGGVQ